jgi:hypothetical protein
MNKPLLIWAGLSLVGLVISGPLQASGVMTLKGTVFSVLRDEYVIQSGKELFYLSKEALPRDTRDQFEKANAHEITLDVPMTAIMKVRTSPEDGGKKRSR